MSDDVIGIKPTDLRQCPQCQKDLPVTAFECLPLDLRCNRCIPMHQAMDLYDKRVQKAGHTLAQVLDQVGAATDLGPVERMLGRAYDSWGGEAAFMEDGVNWIKELADNPRSKGMAVSAWLKLLYLHSKVDRMKLEDDWKSMEEDQIKARLKEKMTAMFAEITLEDAKAKGMRLLTEGLTDGE